eukprot:TRINITY_DN7106_c1_g1_i4.p1 TRINITY_DN7106_c1_g1~~TRINITY_DN7106_c1_g1_i4.p1  ORF type:complete len:631 (-),score=96.11 TRINITY_DN7106_c1_g1_i4:312-2129(-)
MSLNFDKVRQLRSELLNKRGTIAQIPVLNQIDTHQHKQQSQQQNDKEQEFGDDVEIDDEEEEEEELEEEDDGDDGDDGYDEEQADQELRGEQELLQQPQGTLNSQFSKALGSTDWRTREKGLEALKLWLLSKKNIDEGDMHKLWKGLFYCYWHSDKPVMQAELADRLSKVFQELSTHPETQFKFFTSFCFILRREWFGIDALRMDKYLLLVRYFINVLLQYLSCAKWKEQIVSKYISFIEQQVLLDTSILTARGFSYHIYDIFVEEIEKAIKEAGGSCPRQETWSQLFDPFIKIMVGGRDSEAKRVAEGVFETLFNRVESIQEGDGISNNNNNKNDVEATEKVSTNKRKFNEKENNSIQNGEIKVSVFKHLDLFWLADWLFNAGSEENVNQANREILYSVSGLAERTAKRTKRIRIGKENQVNLQDYEKESSGNAQLQNGNGVGVASKKLPANSTPQKQQQQKLKKIQRLMNQANLSQSGVPVQGGVKKGLQVGIISKSLREKIKGLLRKQHSSTPTPDVQQTATKPDKDKQSIAVNGTQAKTDRGVIVKSESKIKTGKPILQKHIRWSMKKNLVHQYGEPAPPKEIRSPPNTIPKGSALRKNIL